MTMQYLIMCRSLTQAQKAAAVLERRGFIATVVKAPQLLRGNGCGYAISMHRRVDEAIMILRQNKVAIGKIYHRQENGQFREVTDFGISG
ncbi:MAG: DUF3343 domain-containing protein [Oscillospiraceae bacterium]|nr:DUF3343 domain-containing protein [Oscillospiraceae bacterium]